MNYSKSLLILSGALCSLTHCGAPKTASGLAGTGILLEMRVNPGNTAAVLQCHPLTLSLVRESEKHVQVVAPEDIPVSVSIPTSAELKPDIYTDATCTTLGSSSNIAKGTTQTKLYLKSNSPGLTSITTKAEGYTSLGSFVIRFQLSRLSLSHGSGGETKEGFLGNLCQMILIQKDSSIPSGTRLTVSVQGLSGLHPTLSSCETPSLTPPQSMQVTLDPLAAQSFFVRVAPSATEVIVNGEAPGVDKIDQLSIKTQPITLLIKTEATSTETSNPTTVKANQCAAIKICSSLTGGGQCLGTSSLAVNLSVSGLSGAALYSDAQCQTATSTLFITEANRLGGTVYLKSSAAGQATITASATGLTPVATPFTIQ